ncbi:RNA polymerase sigma factor [Pollutibacter soli]|uniref:RNA polymerase sigma factor n=1 Tax=Pollutibacter soli TaxID=3034157 RepID=UPI003013768A
MYEINGNNFADRSLVSQVLNGNPGAFKIIIKDTEKLIAQIIFKMIGNAEDRKDIAQDVYLKAFHGLTSFRFESKLSTWIAQITYNTCLNYLDKKKLLLFYYSGEEDEYQEELIDNLHFKHTHYNNETEASIHNKELAELLKMEIDKLSPIYRTLITLYHNESLSYAELSLVTGLPEGTVKSYLFRARKELKDNLAKKFKKEML